MAMASVFAESLQCSVCRDIFRDPVLLLCSHSFCRACVHQYWEHSGSRICPECRALFPMEHPPCNRALKNLCEIFLQERSRSACAEARLRCEEHGETLELFCVEEHRLMCRVCVEEEGNTCIPVEEAAHRIKEKLRTRLEPLREQLKLLQSQKLVSRQRVKRMQYLAEQAEADLRTEIEDLHQFLRDEEQRRVTALREEEEEKRMKMEESISRMSREISALALNIHNTEQQIQTSSAELLMSCRDDPDSFQSFSLSSDSEDPPEELLDVCRHLGNLKFSVWQKMRSAAQYTPVVLDPNSAHPCVRVCVGLRALRFSHRCPPALCIADGREGYSSVLGSVALGSGSHRWDVHVGDSSVWALGVISESTLQTRDQQPEPGLWILGFQSGAYGQGCCGESLSRLGVRRRVHRVTVLLDWDAGKLTFLDSLTGDHIHTFTHRFTDRLFPYFCNSCPSEELRILPVEDLTTHSPPVDDLYTQIPLVEHLNTHTTPFDDLNTHTPLVEDLNTQTPPDVNTHTPPVEDLYTHTSPVEDLNTHTPPEGKTEPVRTKQKKWMYIIRVITQLLATKLYY
ncbi:tripartite motif containing 35-27 [Danio aesculapii]|uniref:tripartite motif containing 35-27 n=1 Tax=Danio aesculapii TaxID=1142201 RepID=UPI0024BF6759|nr:tripartite motif containing 35-27 [Danio aesculapii]